MADQFPFVSFVTPTLNASKVLETELESIRTQDYPQNKIEIIIADGGSTDDTLKIASKYKAKIYKNPLKTGEAGKAVAVKRAKGEFVVLIDSDNILPSKDWLKKMIKPLLSDKSLVGSEPWEYTHRKEGGFIERYSALTGFNDPIVMFYGNYDRRNLLTDKWTGIKLKQKDMGDWIKVTLEKDKDLPTIGANGTIFRNSFLKRVVIKDYLFDIDVLASEIKKKNQIEFAKVKIGIIHTFCESDIRKFARKQKRRVLDYYQYKAKNLRSVNWEACSSKKLAIVKFILYTILTLPSVIDSIKGYIKKRDPAWFFHPLACWITLWEYTTNTVKYVLFRSEVKRDAWKQ